MFTIPILKMYMSYQHSHEYYLFSILLQCAHRGKTVMYDYYNIVVLIYETYDI